MGVLESVEEPLELNELLSAKNFVMMAIGGPDTGKSSFIREKATDFAATGAAVVDLDSGQQSIGLPTSIAWCSAKELINGNIEKADFFFTGSTSPSSNIGRHLVGSELICRKAREKAGKVLIDTSGLVAWPIGIMLKLLKIQLLDPDIIVTFERSRELDHIISALKNRKRPKIFRLPASEKAAIRSQKKRAQAREEAFRRYFRNAGSLVIDVGSIGVSEANLRFRDIPTLDKDRGWFEDRIVGIQGPDGSFIAMGLIREMSKDGKKLTILTHPEQKEKIASIVIGHLKIDPGGEQLFYR